eukprot:gene11691-11780_t
MEQDSAVLTFGEDVGYFGGVFRVTDGLQKRHGLHRCFDTPIAEGAIVAAAIGMGANGLRPVVEIQFADYIYPAMDQIVSEAARLRYRSAAQFTAPITIRSPYGGGIFGGQVHSQSPEGLFTHVVGLKTVVPSNPYDAKGLLISAIEDDDPVIFLEPKRLYNGPFEGYPDRPVQSWADHPNAEVPEGYYTIPLGAAAIVRPGSAVTVLAYGTMVHVAMAAVAEEHCFYSLVSPIERVTGWDTPYPHAFEWEYFPGPKRIAAALHRAPDIGEGTAEVELVAWHVAIGDVVEEDQPLADLMTEKATVEVPSPVAGRIVDLKRKPGEMAAVGSPLVIIETSAGQTGEDVTTPEASAAVATPPRSVATPVQTAPPPIAITAQPPTPDEKEKRRTVTRVPGAPVLASPAVRARAVALGVKLQFVDGTGPGGRVLAEDLDAFLASTPDSARPTARSLRSPDTRIDDIPIIGLRRRIAQQMQEAKRRIPHFSYIEEVDVTDLEVLRGQVNAARNEADPKLTLLPFLIVALVAGLRRFPQMNARFDDEAGVFRRYGGIHLGVATQTPNGLIVP